MLSCLGLLPSPFPAQWVWGSNRIRQATRTGSFSVVKGNPLKLEEQAMKQWLHSMILFVEVTYCDYDWSKHILAKSAYMQSRDLKVLKTHKLWVKIEAAHICNGHMKRFPWSRSQGHHKLNTHWNLNSHIAHSAEKEALLALSQPLSNHSQLSYADTGANPRSDFKIKISKTKASEKLHTMGKTDFAKKRVLNKKTN